MTARGASSGLPKPDSQARLDGLFADEAGNGDVPECQTCGACCSYSSEWPRFTTESDEALDMVPLQFVSADQRGMRCEDERCSALSGRVGVGTACLVYDVRPDVCRACLPGDYACKTARAAHGLE